jgi:outer membrane protein TolC
MKKLLLIPLVGIGLQAITLTQLFDAVQKAPETQINDVITKNMKINKESVKSSLFPKISINASIEHYNRDMSLVPLTPTESKKEQLNKNSLPFGQNIAKIGIGLSMPIFVKEIYENKKKMEDLVNAVKLKSKIDLLKRDALLIGLLSNFNYLEKLKETLKYKQFSIKETIKSIKTGVDAGAIPEFNLIRLQDALTQIDIKISDIETKINSIKSEIYKLTNIVVDYPMNITFTNYQKDDFFALQPIEWTIKADEKNVDAQKAVRWYPKLFLKANISKGYVKSYNTDDIDERNIANIGLYLQWNIFDKVANKDIQKAKIALIKDRLNLIKTQKDLTAEANKFTYDLVLIQKEIASAKKSIKLKKELLKSAKIAFSNQAMTVDEYLGYETDLANTKATLAGLNAQLKETVANLAFIYGNDFNSIFKEQK